MIENIQQAVHFYARQKPKFDPLGLKFIRKRDRPVKRLAEVAADLGLPKSYVDVVNKFEIEDVQLGSFRISPDNSADLCAALLALNTKHEIPRLPPDMVCVGWFEADIIAVPSGEPIHDNGRVYHVDISSSPEVSTTAIAENFEDFIVFASALDQSLLEGFPDPVHAVARVVLAKGYPDYAREWIMLADMVI